MQMPRLWQTYQPVDRYIEMSVDTRQKIMQSAEDKIRTEGYQSFSFRTIASELGIKSASVHYHFATKADLAEAVAERYVDRFFTSLEDALVGKDAIEDRLEAYFSLFRHSLLVDRKLCLCGMLGAEMQTLPESVVPRVTSFFTRNVEWLAGLLEGRPGARAQALALLASLEGALIVSRAMEDDTAFEQVVVLARQQFLAAA